MAVTVSRFVSIRSMTMTCFWALFQGQHSGEIATRILKVLLERDGFYAI
jgi:hypothetical protein